jgi:hypothetical protein
MRKTLPLFLIFLMASLVYADTSVRILPHKWNLHSNAKSKARVKAEIRGVDPTTIDTATIFMNGIAPLKTRNAKKKVIAFFSKRDVLGTLGPVSAGDVVSISVSFTLGNAPNALSDDVKIVGGKKKQPPQPPVTPGKP